MVDVDPYSLGALDARITEHDRRLDRINGSQATTAAKLTEIALALQSLVDGDKARVESDAARDTAVLATAAALKEAQEQRWSTPTRISIVLGGFCALAILVLTLYLAFRHNTITQLPVKGAK